MAPLVINRTSASPKKESPRPLKKCAVALLAMMVAPGPAAALASNARSLKTGSGGLVPSLTYGIGGAGGAGGSSAQSMYSPQFVVGSGDSQIGNYNGQDIANSDNGGWGGNGVQQPQQPQGGGYGYGRKMLQYPSQQTFGAGGPGGAGGSSLQGLFGGQFVTGSGNSGIYNSNSQSLSNSNNGGWGGYGVMQPQQPQGGGYGYGRKLQQYPSQQTYGAGGPGGNAGNSAQGMYSPQFVVGSGDQGIYNQNGQSIAGSSNGGYGGNGVQQPAPQGAGGGSSGAPPQGLFGNLLGGRKLQQAPPSTTAGYGGSGGAAGSSGQFGFGSQFTTGSGNQGIFNQNGQSLSNSGDGGYGGAGVYQPPPQTGGSSSGGSPPFLGGFLG